MRVRDPREGGVCEEEPRPSEGEARTGRVWTGCQRARSSRRPPEGSRRWSQRTASPGWRCRTGPPRPPLPSAQSHNRDRRGSNRALAVVQGRQSEEVAGSNPDTQLPWSSQKEDYRGNLGIGRGSSRGGGGARTHVPLLRGRGWGRRAGKLAASPQLAGLPSVASETLFLSPPHLGFAAGEAVCPPLVWEGRCKLSTLGVHGEGR